jgi:hypothetical protein
VICSTGGFVESAQQIGLSRRLVHQKFLRMMLMDAPDIYLTGQIS